MTPTETTELILKYAIEYIPLADRSIQRNEHMHNYRGLVQSPIKISEIITEFIKSFNISDNYTHNISKISLLEVISTNAKIFTNKHMAYWMDKYGVPENYADALIVDFINYVAYRQGIDYGLYTSDLYKGEV